MVTKKCLQRKRRLKRHLASMRASLPGLLEDAFNRYYEDQPLNYLDVEEKLYRFDNLILKLEAEVDDTERLGLFQQLAGRVNYVADQLDSVESSVYRRPRRRRRIAFNLSDLFDRVASGNGMGSETSRQEISSLSEAYQTLNLEEGCSLSELMTAFRGLAKQYHPDTRGGDRSEESELRRIFEAYQVIKDFLAD